jgi:hypothetical protein
MGSTGQSAPPAPTETQAPEARGGRSWNMDEIVVAAFAIFGVVGGVFLPLRFDIPPITTSFLLATGLAALAYRFLGGIPGTSITVGALKLGGALAALVGIALIINNILARQLPQPHEVWQVSGQVVDEQGVPIPYFDPSDISIVPSTIDPGLQGKFQVMVTSWPDINGNPQFPVLAVSHAAYGTDMVDLNPNAKNDVAVTRTGQSIVVGTIQLHKLANYNPTQQLKPAPPDAATTNPTSTQGDKQ